MNREVFVGPYEMNVPAEKAAHWPPGTIVQLDLGCHGKRPVRITTHTPEEDGTVTMTGEDLLN